MDSLRAFIGIDELNIEILRMLLAEFIGTFFYVFVGVTSSVSPSGDPLTSVVSVSVAFGLASSTISHVVRKASGAHLNPAVSVSCLIVGEMSLLKCILYVIVQCAGSCVAALSVHHICAASSLDTRYGVTKPLYVGKLEALIIEICITFLVILIFKSMTDPLRDDLHLSQPLVIGVALIAGHLVGYLLSFASMNPARSFGPALVNQDFIHHWIYWVGPMIGGVLGGLYYYFAVQEHEPTEITDND